MSTSADELAKTLKDIQDNSVSKSEVEDLVNSLKDGINSEKEKHSSEDFIKHMQECSDKDCSIHMMAKDFEKRGLLKGMALSNKLNQKQVVKN